MADRSVSVLLNANVTGFIAGIEKAKLATRDFASAAEKSATAHKQSWDKVGKGMMLTGGVIAAGLGLAVKTFADFDQSMSRAQAGTMATGSSLASLRKAAIDAGAATQFSATEAADAITAMGKAGVSTKDILGGGLNGALSLAAAGELDVGTAAEIAATAMNQFGLQGKDIPHVADLLAAGAGKAMGSVQDLAGALKYVGPVAKGLGISIEQTTGTLALFAQQGILGEQAGTSMRGMLLSLTSPSKIAAGAMGDLGINVYDAQGKFIGLDGVAGQLHDKLGPLSEATRNQALGQIFGNEQVTAARVLYEGGAGAVQEWTNKVNDSGFAAKQAAMLTDNLKGDVERLGGSLSSVLINAGSGANGMLRSMTKNLQGVVDGYGSLPVPMQKTALGLAGVAAGGLLVTGALISVIPKIAATKTALAEMEVMSGRSGTALRGLGKAAGIAAALAAAAAAMALFSNAQHDAVPGIEATTAALLKAGSATDSAAGSVTNIDALFKGLDSSSSPVDNLATAFKRLTDKSGVDTFSDSVDGLFGAINGATQSEAVFTNIGTALGQLVSSGNAPLAQQQFDAMASSLGLTGDKTDQLMKLMPAYGEAIAGVGNSTKIAGLAAGGAVDPTQAQAQSEKDLAAAADAAKKAHDALTASITSFGSAMLTARGDARGYEAAIDAATASLKTNGKTLDIGTEKGRNNQAALDGIATSALKMAESNLTAAETNGTLNRSSKTVVAQVGKARDAFVEQAVAMGMPRKAAEALATQSGLTAARVKEITDKLIALGNQKPKPKITVEDAAANAALAAIKKKITGLPNGTVNVSITGYAQTYQYLMSLQAAIRTVNGTHVRIATGAGGQGGTTVGKAAGGLLTGPGTGTSDSINVRASNGEFWVNAHATARNLPLLHAINNGAPGFAAGGQVGAASTLLATGAQYHSGMTAGRSAAQIGSSIDAITALTAAWKAAIDVAAALASRADLVRAVAHASKKDVAAARAALRDFDKAAATTRADAIIAARQSALAARQQVAGNKESWAFDHKSAAAQLADVTKRLAAEKKYSDGWMTLAKQRETLAAGIADTAQKAADALAKTSSDYAAGVASKQSGTGGLAGLFFNSDGSLLALSNVQDGLKAATKSATDFQATISALSSAGLDKGLLDQIIGEGAGKGGQMGSAILAGGATAVSDLNVLQTGLVAASAGLGQTAADGMYGAGVQTVTGLVDGLASAQPALAAQMVKIANTLTLPAPAVVRFVSAPAWSQSTSGGSGAASGGGDIINNNTVMLDGKVLFASTRREAISEARRNGTSGIPA